MAAVLLPLLLLATPALSQDETYSHFPIEAFRKALNSPPGPAPPAQLPSDPHKPTPAEVISQAILAEKAGKLQPPSAAPAPASSTEALNAAHEPTAPLPQQAAAAVSVVAAAAAAPVVAAAAAAPVVEAIKAAEPAAFKTAEAAPPAAPPAVVQRVQSPPASAGTSEMFFDPNAPVGLWDTQLSVWLKEVCALWGWQCGGSKEGIKHTAILSFQGVNLAALTADLTTTKAAIVADLVKYMKCDASIINIDLKAKALSSAIHMLAANSTNKNKTSSLVEAELFVHVSGDSGEAAIKVAHTSFLAGEMDSIGPLPAPYGMRIEGQAPVAVPSPMPAMKNATSNLTSTAAGSSSTESMLSKPQPAAAAASAAPSVAAPSVASGSNALVDSIAGAIQAEKLAQGSVVAKAPAPSIPTDNIVPSAAQAVADAIKAEQTQSAAAALTTSTLPAESTRLVEASSPVAAVAATSTTAATVATTVEDPSVSGPTGSSFFWPMWLQPMPLNPLQPPLGFIDGMAKK